MVQSAKRVSIQLLPGLNGLEIVAYDDTKGGVYRFGAIPIEVDPYSRQMKQAGQLKSILNQLYAQSRISKKLPVTLVLPGFYSRELRLPPHTSDAEKRVAIESDVQQFFMFKNQVPRLSWINIQGEKVLYSAYPQAEIEHFIQACQALDINLAAIDLNYTAILKGLAATGAIQTQLENQEQWALLVISDTIFFAAMLEGTEWFKTLERPLTQSGASTERLLSEIQADFTRFMGQRRFSKVVTVNNSDGVDSDLLLETLAFDCPTMVIQQNWERIHSLSVLSSGSRSLNRTFSKTEETDFPCTLEALGAVFYDQYPEIGAFNFADLSVHGRFWQKDRQRVILQRVSGFYMIAIALSLSIAGVLGLINFEKTLTLNRLKQQVDDLSKMRVVATFDEILQQQLAVDLSQVNNSLFQLLVLAPTIKPPSVWLTQLQVKAIRSLASLQGNNSLSIDNVGPSPSWYITMKGGATVLPDIEAYNAQLNAGAAGGLKSAFNLADVTITSLPSGQFYYGWKTQTGHLPVSISQPVSQGTKGASWD